MRRTGRPSTGVPGTLPARPRRATPAALAAALLLAASLAGCRSLPEMDLNPLIRVEHRPDGSVEIEALGPFIAVLHNEWGTSHAFRPLYQYRVKDEYAGTDWLAPLGRHWRNPDGSKWRFWPLIWTGNSTRGPEGRRWNTVVFPLVFIGGGDPKDANYFAFFPIAGRTKRLFGIDQFDFFLWPLFMRTHMRVTEPSTSWTVLFLIGWTDGGVRDGSWRFLPFYRKRLVRDPASVMRTNQRTALWPFFTWGYDHLDTDDPSWRWGFWPLWGREDAEGWYRTTVLWPFFRFNRQRVEDDPDYLYDTPWPLLRRSRSKNHKLLRLFPFYSRYDSPELKSRSYLIPFGRYRRWPGDFGKTEPEPTQQRDIDVFPFWHDSWRLEHDGTKRSDFTFWPLFHNDRNDRGHRNAAFPSLIPFRWIPFMQPADELYSPFLTLWRRRSDGVSGETRLLLDTCMWRDGPEGPRTSIPFLYSRRPEADGVSRRALLWGLVTSREDDGGLAEFRILGVPLWRR